MLAMVSLLDDLPRAERYGAAGRARVEAGYTWARRTERLARILADASG
jgi:glycosyltransferase involved in cell wall biosynthesis